MSMQSPIPEKWLKKCPKYLENCYATPLAHEGHLRWKNWETYIHKMKWSSIKKRDPSIFDVIISKYDNDYYYYNTALDWLRQVREIFDIWYFYLFNVHSKCTWIHCTQFVSMNLENTFSLQRWPVLDAVSLKAGLETLSLGIGIHSILG